MRQTSTKPTSEPGQGDLECFVAGNEGRQASQRLLAGSAYANQEGVASGHADYPRDFHEVDHGVLEEDEIHSGSTNTLVVLSHEHL